LLHRTGYMLAVISCLGLMIIAQHQVSAQTIDEEPKFFAFAEGEKGGVSIELILYRLEGKVSGFGKVVENGQRTFLAVRDAALCTDGGLQNPILQTDAEQPIDIWTPACVDVEVKLLRPPYDTSIVRLSECEPDNTPDQVCDLGGGETAPQGSCLGNLNRDTIQWKEAELPGETIIIVPQFQAVCWDM
jgi:hypothetical protein